MTIDKESVLVDLVYTEFIASLQLKRAIRAREVPQTLEQVSIVRKGSHKHCDSMKYLINSTSFYITKLCKLCNTTWIYVSGNSLALALYLFTCRCLYMFAHVIHRLPIMTIHKFIVDTQEKRYRNYSSLHSL